MIEHHFQDQNPRRCACIQNDQSRKRWLIAIALQPTFARCRDFWRMKRRNLMRKSFFIYASRLCKSVLGGETRIATKSRIILNKARFFGLLTFIRRRNSAIELSCKALRVFASSYLELLKPPQSLRAFYQKPKFPLRMLFHASQPGLAFMSSMNN